MGRPGILLADDHILVLEALKKLLETEFDVVGTVSDGRALLLLAPALRPDVILLDIGMANLGGMEAGLALKRLLPLTKIIILTMNEDTNLASEALQQWASGYLLKESAGTELVKAIREALKGGTYVTLNVAQKLQEDLIRHPRISHKKELTLRQREVLQLLAEGRTMKETAIVLHVTPRTIAFHKYRIMEDFGLKTNSDLVKFAIRERVIPPI